MHKINFLSFNLKKMMFPCFSSIILLITFFCNAPQHFSQKIEKIRRIFQKEEVKQMHLHGVTRLKNGDIPNTGFKIFIPLQQKIDSYWISQTSAGLQWHNEVFLNTILAYRKLLWRRGDSPLLFSLGMAVPQCSLKKIHWLSEVQFKRIQISHNFSMNAFFSQLINKSLARATLRQQENRKEKFVRYSNHLTKLNFKDILESSNLSLFFTLKRKILGCFFRYRDQERRYHPAYSRLRRPGDIVLDQPFSLLKIVRDYLEIYGPNYLLNLKSIPEVGIRIALFRQISAEITTRGFNLSYHYRRKKDPLLSVNAKDAFDSDSLLLQDTELMSENIYFYHFYQPLAKILTRK